MSALELENQRRENRAPRMRPIKLLFALIQPESLVVCLGTCGGSDCCVNVKNVCVTFLKIYCHENTFSEFIYL